MIAVNSKSSRAKAFAREVSFFITMIVVIDWLYGVVRFLLKKTENRADGYQIVREKSGKTEKCSPRPIVWKKEKRCFLRVI